MSNHKRTIYSLDELNALLTLLLNSNKNYVFRGYNDLEQRVPKYIRNKYLDDHAELEMLEEFETYASKYIKEFTCALDFIACAQHFGIPTRLLDFTKNPYIAVFFALYEKNDSEGYHLMWFDIDDIDICRIIPFECNREPVCYVPRMGFASHYTKECASVFECQTDSELLNVVIPSYTNERLEKQQGLFVLPNTTNKADFLKILDKSVSQIDIAPECRSSILIYLDKLGYNSFNLMPDLANICNEIRSRHEHGKKL